MRPGGTGTWCRICRRWPRQSTTSLRPDLAERAARFRDELATDYLLATREAMRYGAIPEGWRADYAKGLSGLLRLLSLDRDNVRLLTAMVEICNDWFLDLYNAGDPRQLAEHVDRFTPFATQLARLVGDRSRRPGGAGGAVRLLQVPRLHDRRPRPQGGTVPRGVAVPTPATTTCASLLQDLGEPADARHAPPEPAIRKIKETRNESI